MIYRSSLILALVIILFSCKKDASFISILEEDSTSWAMGHIDIYSHGGSSKFEYYGTYLDQGTVDFDNGVGTYDYNGKTYNFTYDISSEMRMTFQFVDSITLQNADGSAFLEDYVRMTNSTQPYYNVLQLKHKQFILRRDRYYPTSSYWGDEEQIIEIYLFNESN